LAATLAITCRWFRFSDAARLLISVLGSLHTVDGRGAVVAALAACMDSTTRMLAEQLGVAIDHLEVEAIGDVDVRGCLAVDPSVRPEFRGSS